MAAKQLAILTSDWHYQKYAWSKYPTLYGDSYYSVSQIIDYAVVHHLPVFAAGDLVDKIYPDSHTVYEFKYQLGRLENAELTLYFQQGQHERVKDTPWFVAPNTVHLHKSTCEDIKGLQVYGLDYCRPEVLKEEVKSIPRNTNLFCCHQSWAQFIGEHRLVDGNFDMLPKIDIMLSGDLHKFIVQRCLKEKHKWLAISPGSVNMQSIDEDPVKYFLVLYDDLTVEPIQLETRKVYRGKIQTEKDLSRFMRLTEILENQEGVPEEISKNIVDVIYNPEIPGIYEIITNYVGNKAHLFMRTIKTKQGETKSMVDKTKLSTDMVNCLHLICEKDTQVYNLVRRLLQSNPPDEVTLIAEELLSETSTS